MTDTTAEQPNGKILQWFSIRLENHIDRVWLGTALAVASLAWLLLGMEYIALFLIGYFYTFLFFARKRIVINYPLNGTIIHSGHSLPPKKRRFIGICGILLVYLLSAITYNLNLSPEMLAALIASTLFGWAFLAQHQKLFSAYAEDTKSPLHDPAIKTTNDTYAKFIRYWVLDMFISALWFVVLFLFLRGWFGSGVFSTGSTGDRYAIFAPVAVNLALFYIITSKFVIHRGLNYVKYNH